MMKLSDLLLTALTNLWQRKARTLLTVLGVVIGTMAIVMMVALGEGSQRMFLEQISQSTDLTRIEVSPSYSSGKAEALDDETLALMEAMPNVRTVMPLANVPIYLKSRRYAAQFYATAVPLEQLKTLGFELEWGSLPAKSRGMQVLLGYSSAQEFRKRRGNKSIWELQPATDIDLAAEKFDLYIGDSMFYEQEGVLGEGVVAPRPLDGTISGVGARTDGEQDYQVYVSLDALKDFIQKNKKAAAAMGITADIQRAQVYATDMDAVEELVNGIKELGLQAYSPMEYIKQMQEESRRQAAQWGAVGAIALLVSAIGIANTMLTSIMERKREIGVLKVLGCGLAQIHAMFLLESGAIGMLGGILGVGASYLLSFALTNLPVQGTFLGSFVGDGGLRFIITPYLAAAAILGAMLVGMVAGIYPATRAMRMSPLAALRDE